MAYEAECDDKQLIAKAKANAARGDTFGLDLLTALQASTAGLDKRAVFEGRQDPSFEAMAPVLDVLRKAIAKEEAAGEWRTSLAARKS